MRHRSEGSDEKTHLFGNFRQCGGFSFLGNGRGKDTKAAWPGWNRVVGVQELNANKGNHEMAFGDEGFELLPYHESRRSLSFAFGFMWMK